MRTWRLSAGAALAVAAGVLIGLPATPAVAYDAPQTGIVNADPANWTPNVVSSGGVRYVAQTGNTVIAGGNFSQVRNPGSSTTISQTNLFSFTHGTGIVNPGFAPVLDGMVHAIVVAPGGQQVIVGGEFKKVNGVNKIGLVALDLADGKISTAIKTPTVNGRVFTMRIANGKVYIGGAFTTAGGQPIGHLAAFDPLTGAVDPTQTATFAGVNHPAENPGTTVIIKIDISPDGRRLAAVGNFATVNGEDRPQAVQLDLGTPTPTVLNWVTDRYRAACLTTYQTYMHDVEFSPDGSYFVIVTTGGGYYGGGGSISGCDSVARWDTKERGSQLQPAWINFSGNDTYWSIAVSADAVYIGGHNRWQNNPWGSDVQGPGAVNRPGLAALDPHSGVPFDWNPGRITGVGVFDMLVTDDGLWIGHDTNWVGGEYHYKIAYFPLSGGKTVPEVTAGRLPADLVQLGTGTAGIGTLGSCGSLSPLSVNDVALHRTVEPGGSPIIGAAAALTDGGTAWSRVRGAFMLSGQLYTAWPSGELCVSSFDGTTFGPPQVVEQYANKFVAELPTVTAMFFDNNRIYYTKSGSKTLWYRHFTPQSQIIGAASFVASGNVTGIDFSLVNGMFLSGDHLYYGTRTDRTLRRIDWNGSAPVGGGTSVLVSGPTVDGVSWAQNAMFVYAPAGALPPNREPRAVPTVHCTGFTCDFGSTGSIDPDGVLASYEWDFGDGTTASGPSAVHTYGSEAEFTARLTVTDSDGATDSNAEVLTIGPPQLPPVPAFDVSCTQLTCTVDASSSSDPDGTITSYDWAVSDGAALTGAQASHEFLAAGAYTITLSVTDDDGITRLLTRTVNVAAATSGITYVAGAHLNGNANSWTLTVPPSVVAGDGLLLSATTTATSLSAPSGTGWTLVASRTVGGATTKLWQKAAGASDAGGTVRFTTPSLVKTAVSLLAYRGTATIPVASATHAARVGSGTTHVTPTVAAPAAGSWVVSMWTDKSSLTSALTAPASETVRASSCSTLSGHVCMLMTDGGVPVDGTTSVGGLSATADAASSAVSLWTVVLAPAG